MVVGRVPSKKVIRSLKRRVRCCCCGKKCGKLQSKAGCWCAAAFAWQIWCMHPIPGSYHATSNLLLAVLLDNVAGMIAWTAVMCLTVFKIMQTYLDDREAHGPSCNDGYGWLCTVRQDTSSASVSELDVSDKRLFWLAGCHGCRPGSHAPSVLAVSAA